MFMPGGNLLSSHDGEEGNANADGEEYDPTIFKTLLIKVVPVYSREDIREQYCINDKELQVIPIISYDLR